MTTQEPIVPPIELWEDLVVERIVPPIDQGVPGRELWKDRDDDDGAAELFFYH